MTTRDGAVALTTEEEGVGLVAGAALGGAAGRAAHAVQRGRQLHQHVLAHPDLRVSLLVLVTMRGEFAEPNPWQVPMGSIDGREPQALRLPTYRVDAPEEVDEVVAAGCDMAFDGNAPVAVLLSQRLIGRKHWTH